MQNFLTEEDISKKLKRDLQYIKDDIIAEQKDKTPSDNEDEVDRYIKFSTIINAVTVINMTKAQYKKYWITQYQDRPDKLDIILSAISKKFQNGLTDKDKIIKLIVYSKDSNTEKINALKALVGRR